ncbi:hypothetical protein ACLCDG_11160, partial [Coxiella burnetii]
RASMRFVRGKTVEQQDVQALLKIRDRLVKSRTALINEIRGLLVMLRTLLIHGARALLRHVKNKTDKKSLWLKALIERRGMNRAC